MRFARSIIAVTGSSVVTVLGLFLGFSPWLEGLNDGGPWSLATKTDFWSGLGLVVVGLATVILYRADLYQKLMASGVISRRAHLEARSADAPTHDAIGASDEALTDTALLALATSVVRDIQQELDGHSSHDAGAAAMTVADQPTMSEDELIRLASGLVREIQGTDFAPTSKPDVDSSPSATPDPLALMSEAELARMAQELLQEIQEAQRADMMPVHEEDSHE